MKIKLSLTEITESAKNAFSRFSVAIFVSIIGTITGIILLENFNDTNYFLINLIHTCLVIFPFLIFITVLVEQRKFSNIIKYSAQVAVIALGVLYYFYLPQNDLKQEYYIRAVILFGAFHLGVAFSPFMNPGSQIGFWEYNKQLFLNFLTSALYSVVLYAGLSLAILAVDNLFNVGIKGEIYGQLFFFLAGFFNTYMFLSKYPKDYESLEILSDYPKGLKLFTQYVLIPLVSIYLIILYAYGFKILIQWELPVGWVSYLIIGFSVTGIFALLLVYPLQDSNENTWIKIYAKWFYWALFPLILLLFVAIGKRVLDYGITENRYFILLIAFWLLGISIYLLINKIKNIKVIPMSLAIIAVLSSFGPWGAFSISEITQFNRLVKILKENKIIQKGVLVPASKQISVETQQKVSGIVYYLVENHGTKKVESLFPTPFKEFKDSITATYSQSEFLLSKIGMSYINSYSETTQGIYYNYNVSEEHNKVVKLNQDDYLVKYFISYYGNEPNTMTVDIENNSFQIVYSPKKNNLSIIYKSNESLKLPVSELFSKIRLQYNNDSYVIPQDSMSISAKSKSFDIKVLFNSLTGTYYTDSLLIYNLNADILIKLNKSLQK